MEPNTVDSPGSRRRRDHPLGQTQVLVLRLLADEAKSVRTLANDWPGLTEARVTGALWRLADRGLVDRQAPHGVNEWHLSSRGREVELALLDGDDEDNDDA